LDIYLPISATKSRLIEYCVIGELRRCRAFSLSPLGETGMPRIVALAPFILLCLVVATMQALHGIPRASAKRKIRVGHRWMTFDEYRKRYNTDR